MRSTTAHIEQAPRSARLSGPIGAARRWLRGDTGISSVEFALALPVLMVLICGFLELGYMYFTAATMDKAAQAGARVAVTGEGEDDGTRMSRIETMVTSTVASLADKGTLSTQVRSFPNGNPSAMVSGAGSPCEIVEVDVSYTYAPITPISGPIFGDTITVHGTDRMINEPWVACK